MKKIKYKKKHPKNIKAIKALIVDFCAIVVAGCTLYSTIKNNSTNSYTNHTTIINNITIRNNYYPNNTIKK